MIIPDVNLLIYAHYDRSRHHEVARKWWEDLLDGQEEVGLPWSVVMSFLRVMTQVGLLDEPMSPDVALDYVRKWFRHSNVSSINPGPDHMEYFTRNIAAVGAGGKMVPDSHIAALAMEHGAVVHTNDRDFSRFPNLLWNNPLRAAKG